MNLEATFPFITHDNFDEYVDYLVEWTLYEVNTAFLQLFVLKIRDLQSFLAAHYPSLCDKMIMLPFYLLQQEN